MAEVVALQTAMTELCVNMKSLIPTVILLFAQVVFVLFVSVRLGLGGADKAALKKHGKTINIVFLAVFVLLAILYFAVPYFIQFMLGQIAGIPVYC